MRQGAVFEKLLPDGREVVVYPMTFGKGRLCIGSPELGEYDDGWCYKHLGTAITAAQRWNGEGDPPVGWTRQLSTGRRRTDGDPEQERVYP